MNRRAYLTASGSLFSGFAGCGYNAEGGTPTQEEAGSVTVTPIASATTTPSAWPTEPIEDEFSGTGSDTISGVEIELTGATLSTCSIAAPAISVLIYTASGVNTLQQS